MRQNPKITTSFKQRGLKHRRLKLLETPREWDPILEEAALAYRDTAVTKVITIDSGRVFRYMKTNPGKYKEILDKVAEDDFYILIVKKRIDDALKRQTLKGTWVRVNDPGKAALYVNKAGARLGIFGG